MKKETVLRCPSSNDSCTYPDCSHILPEKETEMQFTRKTQGSPIEAVKDILTRMTFAELVEVANGLGIPPFTIDDWARGKIPFEQPKPQAPLPSMIPQPQAPTSTLTPPATPTPASLTPAT